MDGVRRKWGKKETAAKKWRSRTSEEGVTERGWQNGEN